MNPMQDELYETILAIVNQLNQSMKKKTPEGYADAQVWTRMLNDATSAYNQLSAIEYQRKQLEQQRTFAKQRQWQNNDFERYRTFSMTPETEPEPQLRSTPTESLPTTPAPTPAPTPNYYYASGESPSTSAFANADGYSVNPLSYDSNSWS
jgi:hypothetical protein